MNFAICGRTRRPSSTGGGGCNGWGSSLATLLLPSTSTIVSPISMALPLPTLAACKAGPVGAPSTLEITRAPRRWRFGDWLADAARAADRLAADNAVRNMETARAADRVAADNAVREMEMRLTAMIANMTRTAENFDVVAVKFQAEVPLVCPSPALVSRTGGRRVPGGGLRQLMPPSAEMCRAVWSGASNKVHLLVAGSPVQLNLLDLQ